MLFFYCHSFIELSLISRFVTHFWDTVSYIYDIGVNISWIYIIDMIHTVYRVHVLYSTVSTVHYTLLFHH